MTKREKEWLIRITPYLLTKITGDNCQTARMKLTQEMTKTQLELEQKK